MVIGVSAFLDKKQILSMFMRLPDKNLFASSNVIIILTDVFFFREPESAEDVCLEVNPSSVMHDKKGRGKRAPALVLGQWNRSPRRHDGLHFFLHGFKPNVEGPHLLSFVIAQSHYGNLTHP